MKGKKNSILNYIAILAVCTFAGAGNYMNAAINTFQQAFPSVSRSSSFFHLQRKCHCIMIEFLKFFYESLKALPDIISVCAEHTAEGFTAVIRDPCELAAVVIKKARSQTYASA